MTRSKKIQNLLFGDVKKIEGNKNLRNCLEYPLSNGCNKMFYWEGNKGLIVTLIEKIKELDDKIIKLENKNLIKKDKNK